MSICAALMVVMPTVLLAPFFDASAGPIDAGVHSRVRRTMWVDCV